MVTYFPAGCFGKLPQFGDFIKHNASSREMHAFDQWLQQGIQLAQRQINQNWGPVYENAPAYHFLFYAESAERFLLGILRPSQDKSARKYPFWVSLMVEKSRLGESLPLVAPALFASFFAQAWQMMQEASRGLEMREIVARTENLKMSLPGDLEQQARQYHAHLAAASSESLWQSLFGTFDDTRKYLLFKNLTEILLPLRGREPGKLTLGLRFPLAAQAGPFDLQVSFWLQATQQLLRNPVFLPVLFWTVPEASRNPYLFLFFGPPSAKNFSQLMQPDLPSDVICELEQEGQDKMAGAEQVLLAPYRALLQQRNLTLKDLLQKL